MNSYKDKCRTCLGFDRNMQHIDTLINITGEDVRLSDILQNFYNFKVSLDEDSFPENICINCAHQLTITYSFKVLIETSNKKLIESLESFGKVENTDFNYESDYKEESRTTAYVGKKRKRSGMAKAHKTFEVDDRQRIFCVECKSEFSSVKDLNEHCSLKHSVKTTTGRDCEYCNEKFEDFRSLVLHRKLHLRPYLCENCWEGFYTVNELSSHSCRPNISDKEKNKSERVLRQCDQCGKSYPPGYIRTHLLTHSEAYPYSCKYCPKKFKVPGGLHSHILWNHKRTRNYKCEVCNATFISSSSRSSHVRKNHLKEKKYGCDSCSKRFFSKSELQRHCLTHTGVKNFHCHMCDKSYQTRYGLNVHLKSHSQMAINILGL